MQSYKILAVYANHNELQSVTTTSSLSPSTYLECFRYLKNSPPCRVRMHFDRALFAVVQKKSAFVNELIEF